MNTIKCPNCGASHYVEHYSMTTALGWTPEYKDGVLVSKNPNTSTTHCTCCECHHKFTYSEQYGEVISITDNGPEISVPTLTIPINEGIESHLEAPLDPSDYLIKESKFETGIQLPTMEMINEINERLEKLEARVFDYWER